MHLEHLSRETPENWVDVNKHSASNMGVIIIIITLTTTTTTMS